MTAKTAYPIQPIVAPDFGRPPVLYVNTPNNAPGFSGAAPWALSPHQTICTNTYMNALFPHVWSTFAEIGDIGISIAARGSGLLQIWAVHPDTTDHLCAEAPFQSGEVSTHTLWLEHQFKGAGRLYMRLVSDSEVTVQDLSWVTDRPALHQPSLSIGLCTFNREDDLAGTLAAISSQRDLSPGLHDVWVVNQGDEFTGARMHSQLDHPQVHLITQPNLGGCGGFTRSMIEATTAQDQATHHLLMDDDIILDPRVLDKVLHFLRYADPSIALGGQMLEVENPTRLYEAGGKLHPQLFVTPVAQDTDIDTPDALGIFSTTPDIDYNAWWFCVLPVATIKKVGLPPPLFIRGDDIEYGCRLAAHGIKTVPLPGCPVWHESFAYKDADWMMYYVFRNRIYLTYMHPLETARRDPLFLLGFMMTLILANRYRSAEMALIGIRDGLAASEPVLRQTGDVIHASLMARRSKWPPHLQVSRSDLEPTEEGVHIPLDTSVFGMVKMSVLGILNAHRHTALRSKPLKFSHLPQASTVKGRSYVAATDASGATYMSYPVRLATMWKLIFKSLFSCARYSLVGKDTGLATKANLERLRSLENWSKAFGSNKT